MYKKEITIYSKIDIFNIQRTWTCFRLHICGYSIERVKNKCFNFAGFSSNMYNGGNTVTLKRDSLAVSCVIETHRTSTGVITCVTGLEISLQLTL